MSDIDLDELRSELAGFAEPDKKGGRSPREERGALIAISLAAGGGLLPLP